MIKIFSGKFSAEIHFVMFLGFFFVRNLLMPLTNDDYAYAFVWDGEHGGNLDAMSKDENFLHRERIQSFGDIIRSQWSHYFTWGGRVVAHSLAQFFLWVGKSYFDIANTIILALLMLIIFRLANFSFRSSAFAVFWIFFNLLFISGESVVTTLSLTGSCSYLWMAIFQLGFLLPYVRAIRERKNFSPTCAIIPLGILAGWSNEAGGLAVVALTGFFILIAHREKIFSTWMLAGLLGVIIGCAMNILAPGNFEQTKFIQALDSSFAFTPQNFFRHFVHGFLPTVAICLFALSPAIYFFAKRGLKNLGTEEILILAFAGAGFLVPCAMMFSPKFDLRVSFISLIFVLVAAVIAIKKLESEFVPRLLLIPIFLYAATLIYSDVSMYRAMNEQLAHIERHRQEEVITLPPLNVSRAFEKIQAGKILSPWIKYFAGIQPQENYCLNVMVSQYYGLKKIVGQ